MEDWSALVCQSSSISQSESLESPESSWTGMDGPSSVLIWTNKKREECLQLDGGKHVDMMKYRCSRLSHVWGGTAEFPPENMLADTKKESKLWTYELIFPISWTCWTGLLKHNALVSLYNCCLLPFPCFSFHFVKMRDFRLKDALRTDIDTEAGQQRPITQQNCLSPAS